MSSLNPLDSLAVARWFPTLKSFDDLRGARPPIRDGSILPFCLSGTDRGRYGTFATPSAST